MKTKHLSLILATALVPVLAWADDNVKEGNSQKEGSSSDVSAAQQAPDRGDAKSPAADPTQQPGKAGVPPVGAKESGNKFDGHITAVDIATKTITVADQDNQSRTIEVFDATKGVTGSEATDWSQLTVGAPVKGVYRRDGEKLIAESLSIAR